jgi:hypothetical protein
MSKFAVLIVQKPRLFPPMQLMLPAHAGLVSSDPVKNAKALLRYSLPINNKAIRKIQV